MPLQASKFEFYEKVVVESLREKLSPINGEIGAVLGKAIDEAGLQWNYAVHIYSADQCWSVLEGELKSLGEFDVRETFHPGT